MLLLVTDIDGTITHKLSHSAGNHFQLIQNLIEEGVLVVFSSSKTFEEQKYLLAEAGICTPFIFENGSAIALPAGFFDYPVLTPGPAANFETIRLIPADFNIQNIVQYLRENLSTPFIDLSGGPENILIEKTGLNNEQLARARNRQYSETIFFEPGQTVNTEDINQILINNNAVAVTGTRFITITHCEATKGNAFRKFRALVKQYHDNVTTIAAGDGQNDLSMLRIADIGFLLTDHANELKQQLPDGIFISNESNEGFSQVYSAIMKMLRYQIN